MNLAVALSEYQLLQVQAVTNHYNIDDLNLIILNKDRIKPFLIDNERYTDILVLPTLSSSLWKRALKSHIEKYENILEEYFANKNTDIFIGGADENVIFNYIKKLADPMYYWNIEEGLANYSGHTWAFKLIIFIKIKVYKHIYGFDIPTAYGQGQVECDKSFRMAPSISTGGDDHLELALLLKDYIKVKARELKKEISFSEDLSNVSTLVISTLSHFSKNKIVNNDPATVYKFHPYDEIKNNIGVRYIEEKVPLEIVPLMMPNLQKIRFNVPSTSLLSISCMDLDVKIEVDFESIELKHSIWQYIVNANDFDHVYEYISKKFEHKVTFL